MTRPEKEASKVLSSGPATQTCDLASKYAKINELSYVAQSYGCDFFGNKSWQATRAMGEALLNLLSRRQQSCCMLYNLTNASLHSIITIRKATCSRVQGKRQFHFCQILNQKNANAYR